MSRHVTTPSTANSATRPKQPATKKLSEPRPREGNDTPRADEHEGGTDNEVGDRTGPGAGYDDEPAKVKDTGGVI